MAILVKATDRYGFYVGEINLVTHAESQCTGEFCSVHNPSDHPLNEAPMMWRADKMTMERTCEHGVGHPDPDDIAHKGRCVGVEDAGWYAVHGCDGCCVKQNDVLASQKGNFMNQPWRMIGAAFLVAIMGITLGTVSAQCIKAHPVVSAIFVLIFFGWWVAIRVRTTHWQRDAVRDL